MKRSKATLCSILQTPNNEYQSPESTPKWDSTLMVSRLNSCKKNDKINNIINNSTENNETQTIQESLFDNFVYKDNLFNFRITQKEIKNNFQQREKLFSNLNQTSNTSFSNRSFYYLTPTIQQESSFKKQVTQQSSSSSKNKGNFQKHIRQFIDIKQLIRHPLTCKKKENDVNNQMSNSEKIKTRFSSLAYKEACSKTFNLEKQQFKSYINNQCQTLNPKIKELSNNKINQLNVKQLERLRSQLDQIKTEKSQSSLSSLQDVSDIEEQKERNENTSSIDYIGEMRKELDDAGQIGRHDDFIIKQAKHQKKLIKRIKEDFRQRQQAIEEQKKQKDIYLIQNSFKNGSSNNQNKVWFKKQQLGENNEYYNQQVDTMSPEQQLDQIKPNLFRQCLAKYSHLKIRNLSYLVQPPEKDELTKKDLKIGHNLKYIHQLNKHQEKDQNSKKTLFEGMSTFYDSKDNKCETEVFSDNLNQQLQQTKQKFQISMKQKELKLFSAIKNSEVIEIQYLLDLYPYLINSLNQRGDTPLIHSVKYCNSSIVEDLIQRGSNLEIQNNAGQTALSIGKSMKREHIVEMIENSRIK